MANEMSYQIEHATDHAIMLYFELGEAFDVYLVEPEQKHHAFKLTRCLYREEVQRQHGLFSELHSSYVRKHGGKCVRSMKQAGEIASIRLLNVWAVLWKCARFMETLLCFRSEEVSHVTCVQKPTMPPRNR